MKTILEKEKKASQMVTPLLYGVIIAAIVSYITIFVTPLADEVPVEITEKVEIVGVTEKGVVVETSTGISVVSSQYSGQIGDIIEVTYSVPVKYLEDKKRLQASFDVFHPNS